MIVAAVALTLLVLSCLLVLAWLRGSALTRAECPRCLSHDTAIGADGRQFCRDCQLSFGVGSRLAARGESLPM